jgi:uncharacterized protein YeaO (DUF488 family)
LTIRIIQLGSPRTPDEGLRLGTVRRPPRGVRKSDFARKNYYDTWLPALSPSAELLKQWTAAKTAPDFASFAKRFRREMAASDASRTLDLLAALSHQTNFALGCYCKDEATCHRSVLRELLLERGAEISS